MLNNQGRTTRWAEKVPAELVYKTTLPCIIDFTFWQNKICICRILCEVKGWCVAKKICEFLSQFCTKFVLPFSGSPRVSAWVFRRLPLICWTLFRNSMFVYKFISIDVGRFCIRTSPLITLLRKKVKHDSILEFVMYWFFLRQYCIKFGVD